MMELPAATMTNERPSISRMSGSSKTKIPEGVLKALDSWSECQFDCECERETSLPDLSFVYHLSSLRTPRKSMRQLVEKDITPAHTTWFRPGRVRESHLKDLQESMSLFKDLPATVTGTTATTTTSTSNNEEVLPPRRRRSAPVLVNANACSTKGCPSRTNSVPTRIYLPTKTPTSTGALPRSATVSGPSPCSSTSASRRNSRRSQTAAARASLPDIRATRQCQSLLVPDELDNVSDLSSVSPKSQSSKPSSSPHRQTAVRTKSNCSKRSLYDLPNHLDVSQTCCSSSSISH
jgi:hypothetical protein